MSEIYERYTVHRAPKQWGWWGIRDGKEGTARSEYTSHVQAQREANILNRLNQQRQCK